MNFETPCSTSQQYHSKHAPQEYFLAALRAAGKANVMITQLLKAFFNTLKTELINQKTYQTRIKAKSSIFEYIEVFYNKIRRHSTIDYYSPNDYEKRFYRNNIT